MFGVITFLLRETIGAVALLTQRAATPEDVRAIVREEIGNLERRTGVLITYQETAKT